MKIYDIMVAGHVCVDIIPDMSDIEENNLLNIFDPGKLTHVESLNIRAGGPVSNTGSNMTALGNVVTYSTRIGNDFLGKVILDSIGKNKRYNGINIKDEDKTSYTISLSPKNTDRIYLHYSGSNDSYNIEDIDEDLLEKSKHFHFGYPPLMKKMYEDEGEELLKIFKLAKEKNTVTSLDMSLPDINNSSGRVDWKKLLSKVLPYTDIFMPSLEEILFMLYPGEYFNMEKAKKNSGIDIIDQIHPFELSKIYNDISSLGCNMILIKLGYKGLYFRSGNMENTTCCKFNKNIWKNKELWVPSIKAKNLIDTTGAGDSAIAGFITSYLKGFGPKTCLNYGVVCGYQNVIQPGASEAIDSWENTTELLNQLGIENYTYLNCLSEKWSLDEETNIWAGPNNKES